jgi:hypothetical protein
VERYKTLIAVAVALVASAVAAITRPKQTDFEQGASQVTVGKPLYDFDDPSKAASLEIIRSDSETASLNRFKIARDAAGSWSIPSHHNYPADATQQVGEACTHFVGQKILGYVTSTAKEHEYFGVLEPTAENAGDDGVGTLVRIEDAAGDELVAMVIGKPDKADPSQRFVRRLGQDAVFVAKVDPSKLPTNFEAWIEKDILRLSVFDVQNVILRDYATVVSPGSTITNFVNRHVIALGWDAVRRDWELQKIVGYANAKTFDAGLQPTEELQLETLANLSRALGKVEIIDVLPKPPGFGSELQMSKTQNENLDKSLQARGFRMRKVEPSGPPRLLADNGEIGVTMKDGIRYVLKFGGTVAKNMAQLQDQNRVLLVTAELDEDYIPLPPQPKLPDPKEGEDEDVAAEREKLKNQYQKQLDVRNDRLAGARRHVLELNDRFAPWYYVISDDVYRNLMLGRSDIVRTKTATGVDGESTPTTETPTTETPGADTPGADTPPTKTPATGTPVPNPSETSTTDKQPAE